MNTYLVNFFDLESFEDDAGTNAWCLVEVDPIPTRNGVTWVNNAILKYRVRKLVCASKNFDYIFDPDACEGLQGRFVPHIESDGEYYICAHLRNEDPNTENDRILKLEDDEEAKLYAEITLKGM